MSDKLTETKWLRKLISDGGPVGSFLVVMNEVPLVKKILDFAHNKGNKEPIKKLEIDLSDYARRDVIAFLNFHYFGEVDVILNAYTDIKDIHRLYMLFDYLGCPMQDDHLRKTLQDKGVKGEDPNEERGCPPVMVRGRTRTKREDVPQLW